MPVGVPTGGYILTKIFVRPEKVGSIFLTQATRDSDQFNNRIGLILDMGSDCYKNENIFPTGAYCKVGDHIMFQRYEVCLFEINGVHLGLVPCNKIILKFEDGFDPLAVNASLL